MKYQLLLVLSLISIFSCEKVDDPYPKNQGDSFSLDGNTEYITEASLNIEDNTQLSDLIFNNNWVEKVAPDNSNRRFITLEEFTGHTCIFCPLGTDEITRLNDIYGEQLIPIAIHAGNFARPQTGNTKFTTDFRPDGDHGQIYLTTFNPGNSYPRGMVSRSGGISKSNNDWENDIEQIKDDAPNCALNLATYYSDSLDIVRAQIDVIWQNDLSEEYSLQLFILESHIIDWQKDARATPTDIPDYDHKHVLRKVVNGTFGKSLDSAVMGDTLSYQYITTLKPEWKSEDIEVVAFIFNSDVNSYEVIQANATHIK